MARLFPAVGFLYVHDSAIDLYLKRLREAIQSIPQGVLQLEYDCYPIITDYSDPREAENTGIVIGYGFHHSDFDKEHRDYPIDGLVFCLNPPHTDRIEKVRMHHTIHGDGIIPVHSSFIIKQNRFLLTSQEFDLDKIMCGDLGNGKIYKKPEPYKPDPADKDACPF